MERRDFMKAGLTGLAVAAALPLAGCATSTVDSAPGLVPGEPRARSIAPRRRELLDADWRFSPEKQLPLVNPVPITHWQWKEGGPNDAAKMTAMHVDTHGWKTAKLGEDVFKGRVGYAWFRTELPPLAQPGRTLAFANVDDNAVVYLNGHKVGHHKGWGSPFEVTGLDKYWHAKGPNVLAVRVQNTAGEGGIYKAVTLGTIPPAQEKAVNPISAEFNDTQWRVVHLPHDYIVEGQYDKNTDPGHGFLPTYPAWYRKTFTVPAADKGRVLWIDFDGIYRDSKVFVNGHFVGRHKSGYTSFRYDISKYVNYGGENVLAVHVNPTQYEGWWYEGGGIYRHVWLNVADQVHVAPWGVYVTSAVKNVAHNPSATLTIQTTLNNGLSEMQYCTLASRVVGPDGKTVAAAKTDLALPAMQSLEITQEVLEPHARLWSLEQPQMYSLVSEVLRDGRVVDAHEQPFGIRTIRFTVNEGFFLNEKRVELAGVCNHQDFPGVGIGAPDSLWYWRVRKLKTELNSNAYRCSHNPMAIALYDACDQLGMLVMDENRHPGDTYQMKTAKGTPYNDMSELKSMILRDRNHPSIIMWSMANEEFGIQSSEYGKKLFAAMMKEVHRYDTTRPISSAMNGGWNSNFHHRHGFSSVENLQGTNYGSGKQISEFHKAFPHMPMFGSEIGSNTSDRGVYHNDKEAGFVSAYHGDPERTWHTFGVRKFDAGGFVWTGFDYRGEPTPYQWPCINSHFGLLDMCGFPKDNAFYYKAWWGSKPLIHLFPHWNWPEKHGQKIDVWVYGRCHAVELVLNGKPLGRKPMPPYLHVQWEVPYEPGTLLAVGFDQHGREVTRDMVQTTGAPHALKMMPDRTRLAADGEDTVPIPVVVVDKQGRVVPTASNMVHFRVTGAGVNAGVANGNPSCHEPNQCNYRSAFRGMCMVLARANARGGAIHVKAYAHGLRPALVTLQAGA